MIHYSGFHEFGKKGCISITSLSEFCDGEEAREYSNANMLHRSKFTPNEIVCRAESRLGEDSYNLLFNNCEHFCNWCTHDDDYSYQTAGVIENSVRQGNFHQADGATLFDLTAPFKNLLKRRR